MKVSSLLLSSFEDAIFGMNEGDFDWDECSTKEKELCRDNNTRSAAKTMV